MTFDNYHKFYIIGNRHEGISLINSIDCKMKLNFSDTSFDPIVDKYVRLIDDSLSIQNQKGSEKNFIRSF